MAAGAAELRRLQWRLEELEQRVGLGGCGPQKVADELVKVQVALNNYRRQEGEDQNPV
uniref:Putative dynactin light chain 3 n=1 Tax=Taeniopygia guttata TaxID=59729 RepID=B5G3H5_TAEGU|nr:putative dynactin light chain 3 [Taeniopygia guttata]